MSDATDALVQRIVALAHLVSRDEIDEAGALWCYTTKRVPDPDVTGLAFSPRVRN